ncbi:MAG: alcohol dehydrogenase catalytic domain-containing protein [Actinomycetota bacterium]
MRAMAVTAYGDPLTEIDVEEPRLREGFALLEVLTCGVCFSDVKTSRGKMPYSDSLQLPHIPGHEICGKVIETDPAGALPTGTVVVAYHIWPCRRCGRCRAGYDNLCTSPVSWTGFTHPGGFRDRLAVPLDRLTVVPDSIDPIRAAPLTCALGTAYRGVVTRGEVTAGSRAVVIGLGGVGIHALQIARATGARVVGLDVSQPSIDAALDLDLDARASDDDALDDIVAATNGEGVDVVIDCVGREETLVQADRLVRPGGRVVEVGYSIASNFLLPTPRFVLEEIELIGSRYVLMDELERAIRLVADGHVHMVVDEGRPLEDVNEAFVDLEAGRVVGRTVIDVAGVA